MLRMFQNVSAFYTTTTKACTTTIGDVGRNNRQRRSLFRRSNARYKFISAFLQLLGFALSISNIDLFIYTYFLNEQYFKFCFHFKQEYLHHITIIFYVTSFLCYFA